MEDKASKTEEATPKRLSDARKKGRVAKSPDLNSAASFFFFVMLIARPFRPVYLPEWQEVHGELLHHGYEKP